MSRTLILLGLLLVLAGLMWPWLGRLGLGRLPGDIVVERDNFTLSSPSPPRSSSASSCRSSCGSSIAELTINV